MFDNFKFDNFTPDVDSLVMTKYGNQQESKKGYNPAKKERPSHHALVAIMWLRSGDSSSANNFLSFLEHT